jgi:hypothetical protein
MNPLCWVERGVLQQYLWLINRKTRSTKNPKFPWKDSLIQIFWNSRWLNLSWVNFTDYYRIESGTSIQIIPVFFRNILMAHK